MKQLELTKAKRAVEKALKDAAKRDRVVDKEKREQTLKSWKEDDNDGQRKMILQLVMENGPFSENIVDGGNYTPSQTKVNQRIGKAKLIAKKSKECGILLPNFPPLRVALVLWIHTSFSTQQRSAMRLKVCAYHSNTELPKFSCRLV